MYTKNDLTWGFELELSNVPKNFPIPEELGKWEFCESDIVNTKGTYKNVCADPLGINPPVGGEINTKPTNTIHEQVDRIMKIIELFKEAGHTDIDVGMTSHSHIHVHVKGLTDDVVSLKWLMWYVYENQVDLFNLVYPYHQIDGGGKIRNYLKNDGARKMPKWLVENIVNKAEDFGDFISLFSKGKDGLVNSRPIRYGVNMYSLKNTQTIEFRCFRGSLNRKQLLDSFTIVEEFILNGLDYHHQEKILDTYEIFGGKKRFDFPPMVFDKGQEEGWLNTKHHVELVKNKNRKYWEVQ